jgi:hypothetical protein
MSIREFLFETNSVHLQMHLHKRQDKLYEIIIFPAALYEYERTYCYLILIAEYRLRVSEKRMLKRIFGPMREKARAV